jgi:hypothetical protein
MSLPANPSIIMISDTKGVRWAMNLDAPDIYSFVDGLKLFSKDGTDGPSDIPSWYSEKEAYVDLGFVIFEVTPGCAWVFQRVADCSAICAICAIRAIRAIN